MVMRDAHALFECGKTNQTKQKKSPKQSFAWQIGIVLVATGSATLFGFTLFEVCFLSRVLRFRPGAGLRHVVLEAASDGIGEAVAALEGALTLGMVREGIYPPAQEYAPRIRVCWG